MFDGFLPASVLLVVLGLVGWGVGFAAALMRTSLRMDALRGTLSVSIGGLALGLLVAAGSVSAYLVVLDRVGILDF